MSFVTFGTFDPRFDYRTQVVDSDIESWATETYDLSESTIYSLSVPTGESKFAYLESSTQPSSSAVWKFDTAKSVKEDDGLLRLHFQRTTPSVAEIGLGETSYVAVRSNMDGNV